MNEDVLLMSSISGLNDSLKLTNEALSSLELKHQELLKRVSELEDYELLERVNALEEIGDINPPVNKE